MQDQQFKAVAKAVHDDYSEYPVLTIMSNMIDSQEAYDRSEEFQSGYSQAMHDMKMAFMHYDDSVRCECSTPWPEMTVDGEWVCAECGDSIELI